MKRIAILAALAALLLSGCKKEPAYYTEDELGVIIEWSRYGYSEVKNETNAPVTLVTSYRSGYPKDITSVIQPGEAIQLDIGAAVPGASIQESRQAIICLADGTEILCVHSTADHMTPWAKQFYTHYEQEQTYEIVDFEGKKLRHNLVVMTYHIDQELIDIWKDNHSYGFWQAIQLDRPEVSLPSGGGSIVVSMLNYQAWWINGGYTAEPDEEGVWRQVDNYIMATSSGSEITYDVLEAGWFRAAVPKDRSNQLVITVEPNLLAKPRYAVIEMECGDVFTHVKITQP